MNTSSSVEIRTEVRFAMMILLVCRSRPKMSECAGHRTSEPALLCLRYLAKVLACGDGMTRPGIHSDRPHDVNLQAIARLPESFTSDVSTKRWSFRIACLQTCSAIT